MKGKIIISIKDLFELANRALPAEKPSRETVVSLAQQHFSFLPQPLEIEITGDDVAITFLEKPPSEKDPALKLALRADKLANDGQYEKAITLWKQAVEIFPNYVDAKRNLAMAYIQTGNANEAKNQLIDVLCLHPKDHWAYVVLANLYIKNEKNLANGERFLRKALEIKPDDAWALNSLAALQMQTNRTDEGILLFRQAISNNPKVANPYYGLALALCGLGRDEEAVSVLREMFKKADIQDKRSQPIFPSARELYITCQERLSAKNHEAATRRMDSLLSSLETLSGYPIKIIDEKLDGTVTAHMQIAWKHGSGHHLIKRQNSYHEFLKTHITVHELCKLQLECKARQAGKNKLFTITPQSRELAIRSLAKDIHRLEKNGHDEGIITDVILSMIQRICLYLLNCPIDMIVEKNILDTMPELAAAQFLSIRIMADETWKIHNTSEAKNNTPLVIMRSSLALNGAYALFLDNLFDGSTEYSKNYRPLNTYQLSSKLWQHWQAKCKSLNPGDEFGMVDDFADLLGLRKWYEWMDDNSAKEMIK